MLKRKLVVVALVVLGFAAQSVPAMAARGWQPGKAPSEQTRGPFADHPVKGFSDGPR